jgi:hypothetical protein
MAVVVRHIVVRHIDVIVGVDRVDLMYSPPYRYGHERWSWCDGLRRTASQAYKPLHEGMLMLLMSSGYSPIERRQEEGPISFLSIDYRSQLRERIMLSR